MELERIAITDSSFGVHRTRLVATVRYDRRELDADDYWIDVPAALGADLSTAGSPWLAMLLPLAVTLGEPLRLAAPVDGMLLANTHRLMAIWRSWYPSLLPVPIEASVGGEARRGSRSAAFFSGGVDSFFTALRERGNAEPEERGAIDDLLTVWGLDVPLALPDAFARVRSRNAEAAAALGKSFVDVATNIRCTRWQDADWGSVAHGCALAGVALALAPRYRRVLIPATGGYRDLHPWGSHPLTDPLFSTAGVQLVHDGAAFTRVEKSRVLARCDAALRCLRVCWKSESGGNCGACGKCWRAMAILHLLGALDRCTTFPRGWDPQSIARIYCAHAWDDRELRDIRSLALTSGRPDIARAAERAMRRSRRWRGVLTAMQHFRRRRGFRSLSDRLEHRVRAELVT